MRSSLLKLFSSAENRVLRSFRDAELHDLLSFDLDLFASGRVATHASFAVHEHELAETRQGERILRVLVSTLALEQ